MKKLLITILLTVSVGFTFAGNDKTKDVSNTPVAAQTVTLKGKVIDLSTNETLTGVEINLEGTDIKVYSDLDGNFEIKDVKPGDYNIVASYISYKKSLVESFNAKTNANVEIKLEAAN